MLDALWGVSGVTRKAGQKGGPFTQGNLSLLTPPQDWFDLPHSQPVDLPMLPANFGVSLSQHLERRTTSGWGSGGAGAGRSAESLGVSKIEDEATLNKLMGITAVCWECAKGHRWSTYERLAFARAGLQPVRGSACSELRKCNECNIEGQRALLGKAKADYGSRAPPPPEVRGYHPANILRQGGCRDAVERATAKCLGSFAVGVDGRGNFRTSGPRVFDYMGGADESLGTAEVECARILACPPQTAPLAILGLRERSHPTADDVRRRFRHLAMRLHPDKTDLPRADEAFKRASEAMRLLGL